MLTTSMDARSRLLKLHSDHRVADALIAKNFHSAVQIADMAPSHFVRLMTPIWQAVKTQHAKCMPVQHKYAQRCYMPGQT